MQIGFETIREILEHRLHQEDIEKLLHGLDETGKAELFFRITEMLRRTSALADIANLPPDTHQAYVGVSSFAHKAGLHA